VAVSLLTAERLTRPTNYPLTIDPRRLSSDARAWSVRTIDGVTLRGWYLPTPERRRLIVLVHGMWSSWLEMAALGRDLHHGEYDVLLFDLRGHGQSDPSRLTLGRRERADIRAVMNWARAEGFTNDRIGWLGYSMGASTLLLEAAQNPAIQVVVMEDRKSTRLNSSH
jgi:pimeloyl-ACP methyl ester carboxylesterase